MIFKKKVKIILKKGRNQDYIKIKDVNYYLYSRSNLLKQNRPYRIYQDNNVSVKEVYLFTITLNSIK